MDEFIQKRARPEIFTLKPYVPGKPIDEVKREVGLDDIIKLASNENPLGPSPLAIEAVKKQLDQLHIYPDANCFYLKNKLTDQLDVDVEQILIGNGSDELLKLFAETFLNPGDEIIYARPTFSEYEFVAKVMGAQCVEVPLKDFKHDLDAMLDAVTPQTKMIFICNPNNPTGTIVDASELDSFVQKVPDDILLMFDEAYYEYVQNNDYISGLSYVQAGKKAVVFRTFSKIYGLAGLRVGYAITDPSIAAAVEKVTEPFNVNALGQTAALAACDDQEHLHRSLALNEAGKQYLYKEFEALGLQYVPTDTNFIFFDTGVDCKKLFQHLLQMGVIVRTGDIFGYPTYLRVTIGSQEENERFIDSLKKALEQIR